MPSYRGRKLHIPCIPLPSNTLLSHCFSVGALFGGFKVTTCVNLRNLLRRSGSSGFTHDYIVFAIELIIRVDLLHYIHRSSLTYLLTHDLGPSTHFAGPCIMHVGAGDSFGWFSFIVSKCVRTIALFVCFVAVAQTSRRLVLAY